MFVSDLTIDVRVFETHTMQTGATVLSGWDPIEWGHCGNGPRTATFDCLSATDKQIVIEATENLFDLQNLPEFFQHGKSLYPLMLACGASLLMWYPERHKKGVVPLLLQKMPDVYGKVKLGLKTRSTTANRVNHDNLMRWGSCIKKQFDRDNLHLLAPTVMDSNKKFTSSIVGCIRGLSSQLTTIVRQQDVLFQKVRELEMSVAEIHQLCLTSTSHPVNDRPPKRSSVEEVQAGDLSPGFGSPKSNQDWVWCTSPSPNVNNHPIENYPPSQVHVVPFWISS